MLFDGRFATGELAANLEKRELFRFRNVENLSGRHAKPRSKRGRTYHQIIGKRAGAWQIIGLHGISSKRITKFIHYSHINRFVPVDKWIRFIILSEILPARPNQCRRLQLERLPRGSGARIKTWGLPAMAVEIGPLNDCSSPSRERALVPRASGEC